MGLCFCDKKARASFFLSGVCLEKTATTKKVEERLRDHRASYIGGFQTTTTISTTF